MKDAELMVTCVLRSNYFEKFLESLGKHLRWSPFPKREKQSRRSFTFRKVAGFARVSFLIKFKASGLQLY